MTQHGEASGQAQLALPSGGRVLLAWGGGTDIGRRRSTNEDSFAAVPPVFAVADGMGGHSAGDVASDAVTARLAESADPLTPPGPAEIALALERATRDIERLAGQTEFGVGTTVTGVAVREQEGQPALLVFNVGDSRVYLLDGNELRRLTRDDSVVQELIDAGLLPEDEAESHPDANVITRAVGFGTAPRTSYSLLPARAGLRLLLCSDGLTKEVAEAGIRMCLAARLSPAETASALIDAALAAGGRDNVTVLVVDLLEVAAGSAPEPVDESTAPRSRR